MRTWIGIAFCAVILLAGISGIAYAAQNNDEAVIAAHIGPYNSKNVCDVGRPACIYLTTNAPPGWYNVYIMIGNISDSLGVAGAQFGINYDGTVGVGVDLFAWSNCGDLEFPSGGSDGQPTWPAPGSGNLMTWDYTQNCQTEADGAILAGIFQMAAYSDDCFSIIPRPVDGRAKIGSCFGAETDITDLLPSHLGYVCFGADEGYNPCSLIVSTHHTTWGGIKTLYD